MMTRAILAAAPLLLVTAIACGRDNTTPVAPSPTVDRITITSLVPANGTSLAPGSTVTFTATVRYELATAESGSVALVVQDQSNRNLLTGPNERLVVANRIGSATFSAQATIAAIGVTRVDLFVALFPATQSRTQVSASASYPVGR